LFEDEGVERWRYAAKCRDMDTELWFPPRDKTKYKVIADKAKAICFGKDGKAECPVRIQCLLYAEDFDEQHGIWGGLSHRERNALKRKAAKSGKSLKEWVNKDETNRVTKSVPKRKA
jgi:WhiB family transcriptional regulator, redox-sensing transcriptional regulator